MNGRLTPEMIAVLEGAHAYERTLPDPFDFSPTVGRAINQLRAKYWNVSLPEMEQVRCVAVHPDGALDTSRLNVICFVPPMARPGAIYYVHGGGWTFSPLTFDEYFVRSLAVATGMAVLAVDYGLAPESQFPRPLNDVIAAWRSILMDPARFAVERGPWVFAGDSAGANLALAAMLHEQELGNPMPSAAALIYGVYEYDPASPSMLLHGELAGPTARQMNAFWRWYAPDHHSRRTNPLVAPLLASDAQLCSLPRMALLSAEIDSLASDSERLAARLSALGRNDIVHVEPGVVHGFMQMGAHLEAARRCTSTLASSIHTLIAEHREKADGFVRDVGAVAHSSPARSSA